MKVICVALGVGRRDQAARGIVLVARGVIAGRVLDVDQAVLAVVAVARDVAGGARVADEVAVAVVGVGLDVAQWDR